MKHLLLSLFVITPLFAQDEKVDFEVKRFTFSQQKPAIVIEHLLLDNLESLGAINGSYLQAAFLRNDDLVYIKLKNPAVSVGDRFMIYGDGGGVAVPGKFGSSVGKDISIKAYCEIVKVTPVAVVAKIYDAAIDVHVGDKVAALIDQNFKVDPKEPAKMVRGQVLRSAKNLGLISPFDFVYLNRGSADGLQINDKLYGYRTAEGLHTIDPGRPPINIAELVIVNLGEHVSTAYVLSAEDSFIPGTYFKSAISEVKFLSDTNKTDATDTPASNEEE